MFNKRINRRSLLKLAGFAAALPIVQACAPAAPPTPTPKPATKVPKPAAEATKPPAVAVKPPAGAVKTKIRYYQVIGSMSEQVDMFNEKSDTIEVVFEQAPWPTHADKLVIDVAAGTAPDVWFVGGPFWIPLKRKKVAYPLGDLLKQSGIDMKGYTYPPDSEWFKADGKIYGVGTNGAIIRGLGYNERIFNEAGVALPTDKWDWDDYTDAAKKLHNPKDVYAMQSFRSSDVMMKMIMQNGGRIVSEDEKTAMVDSPEVVEAVQVPVDWQSKHKVAMAPGEEKALGDRPVSTDKIATWVMVLQDWGTWKSLTNDDTMGPSWVTWWPTPRNPKKDLLIASLHAEAISGNTKNIDAAWEFFHWRNTAEEPQKLQIQWFPCTYGMEKIVKETITNERQRDFMLFALSEAHKAVGEVWGPSTTEIQKAFFSEYDLALLGEKSVEQAMKDAQVAITSILED